jgi:hypothetical protein
MKRLNTQAGQMTTEAILIMVALLGFVFAVSKVAQSQGWLASLTSKPWSKIQGMAESGVWADPQVAKLEHPNLFSRHVTQKPKGQ